MMLTAPIRPALSLAFDVQLFEAVPAGCADLPAAIRFERPSVQRVYRIIRDRGPVQARDIHQRYEELLGDPAGYSTIGHALTALARLGLVEKADALRWRLKG